MAVILVAVVGVTRAGLAVILVTESSLPPSHPPSRPVFVEAAPRPHMGGHSFRRHLLFARFLGAEFEAE